VTHYYPDAPYGFQCQYTHRCPHLNGLSTTWVFENYERADEQYQEHLRIIDLLRDDVETRDKRVRVLERENAELKAKLVAIHQRQFKATRKKKTDNPMVSSPRIKGKKRGAPVGHPGWSRPKPDHVDCTVDVPPPALCPHCQSIDLTPMEDTTEHFQEDIVIQPRTVVTRYVHGQAFCSRCHRAVVQAGEGELLNSQIGPVAKSAAVYLRYRMGLPYRKVADLFREMFGLKFVPASAVGFDRRAAALAVPIYEDLREKIRVSDFVHADETFWRNEGLNHYVWYAGNTDLAFYHIDRHRCAQVAKGIFGEDFKGVVVRDRYAAYNGIGAQFQACLAHIITNSKEMDREHALLPDREQDQQVTTFASRIKALFSEACHIGQEIKSGNLPFSSAKDVEIKFIKRLAMICKHPFRFKLAETLRKYLIGPEQKYLFTFLRIPGVPPTNNQAEQSLRYLVIFRKVCFGTRSESGLLTHSILPSIVHTAKRQGVPPREFLQILFTADTKTAQAALYNSS
jgi:transposase